MKSLNTFINESISIDESFFQKLKTSLGKSFMKHVYNMENITDIIKSTKNILQNKYGDYKLEVKQLSEIIKDNNCATLKIKDELDSAGDKAWDFDVLCKKYKNNDVKVLCIYDKNDNTYALLDIWIFYIDDDKEKTWVDKNETDEVSLTKIINDAIEEIKLFQQK